VNAVLGRESLVESLIDLALDGKTVLLLGPVGIGKTTVLGELARRARESGRPCGVSHRTDALGDLTRALSTAYSGLALEGRSQRAIRGGLRLEVERRPGVLVLDGLRGAGSAFKSFLRSLRGTGLGVLIAADVEHASDRRRVRTLGLASREWGIPPLPPRHLRRVLESSVCDGALPHALAEEDRKAILEAARGRPGWIVMCVERLQSPRYWDRGRVRRELLSVDVAMAAAGHSFADAPLTRRQLGG
jgi:hypothetical protein